MEPQQIHLSTSIRSEELQGLTSCIYVGKKTFLLSQGICFRGLHIEKIVLRWNEYSFCSYMGPNQVRIMDQMASRLSVRPQVSFIKTDTYEGIGQRLIGFCVYVSVVVCHW